MAERYRWAAALLGVASALLTFYLVLSESPWWICLGGSEKNPALSILISPFIADIRVLDQRIYFPLLPHLLLSSKLEAIISAAALPTSIILYDRAWARRLINYTILIIALFFLTGIIFIRILGDKLIGFGLPIWGEKILIKEISMEGRPVTITIPLRSWFTDSLWIALVAGVTALSAKILTEK